MLSIVVPVYRSVSYIEDTLSQILAFEKELPAQTAVEIIAVDDGSDDGSYEKLLAFHHQAPDKIRLFRLSRNFGAINAVIAGMSLVRGDCVFVISQDLQEPLELYKRMYQVWHKEGVKINLGIRISRKEGFVKRLCANVYHFLFRVIVAPNYPKGGLCGYLLDRQVLDEYLRSASSSQDPATQLFLMGYSHRLHPYVRAAPKAKTNWTLSKNIKLVIDNFIAFSYVPIRLMSFSGLVVSIVSFIFAFYVVVGKLTGWYAIEQPPGWATIIVLLTFLLGVVMVMLGIIGEYLWRILDRVKKSPEYLIAESVDNIVNADCQSKENVKSSAKHN